VRTMAFTRTILHHLAIILCATAARLHDDGDNQRIAQQTRQGGYVDYTEAFQYFSKIDFVDPALGQKLLPFQSFPLSEETIDTLQTQSFASSPLAPSDVPYISPNLEIWNLGGLPPIPDFANDDYWQDLREVTEAQIIRRNNGTTPFRLPDLWKDFTIGEVAEAVNNEFPGYWQSRLLESFWKEGLLIDHDILPFVSLLDFYTSTIILASLNTWAITVVCPPSFLLKWTVGRLRPEEAAYQVAVGLRDDVPDDLKELIQSMDLTKPEDFTAYEKGSPTHPSWPAMHSAASAASLWLATVTDLTDDQYCQLLLMDYAVAFARTVAGVHYTSDNIAGLNLGQRLITRALPDHLTENFGAPNKAAIYDKMEKLLFDWATFDPESCTYS